MYITKVKQQSIAYHNIALDLMLHWAKFWNKQYCPVHSQVFHQTQKLLHSANTAKIENLIIAL